MQVSLHPAQAAYNHLALPRTATARLAPLPFSRFLIRAFLPSGTNSLRGMPRWSVHLAGATSQNLRPHLPPVLLTSDVDTTHVAKVHRTLPTHRLHEGADVPRGDVAPSGWLALTHLAIGHQAEVSTLSSRGNRCIPCPDHYSPAFAFSAILYPQQFRQALRPDLSPPHGCDSASGLPCSVHRARVRRTPPVCR